MATDGLKLRHDGELAELAFARPERQNAVNRARRVLASHCGGGGKRSSITRRCASCWCAVREGYSAGADIAEFAKVFADRQAAHDYHELVQNALSRLDGWAGRPSPPGGGGVDRGGRWGGAFWGAGGGGVASHCRRGRRPFAGGSGQLTGDHQADGGPITAPPWRKHRKAAPPTPQSAPRTSPRVARRSSPSGRAIRSEPPRQLGDQKSIVTTTVSV